MDEEAHARQSRLAGMKGTQNLLAELYHATGAMAVEGEIKRIKTCQHLVVERHILLLCHSISFCVHACVLGTWISPMKLSTTWIVQALVQTTRHSGLCWTCLRTHWFGKVSLFGGRLMTYEDMRRSIQKDSLSPAWHEGLKAARKAWESERHMDQKSAKGGHRGAQQRPKMTINTWNQRIRPTKMPGG